MQDGVEITFRTRDKCIGLVMLGVTAVTTLLFSYPAFAHPGHDLTSIWGGALHPLTGLDHLLTAVAVGLWAEGPAGRMDGWVPLGFIPALCGNCPGLSGQDALAGERVAGWALRGIGMVLAGAVLALLQA